MFSEYGLSKNITSDLIKSFSENYNFFYKDWDSFNIWKMGEKSRLVCGAILKALKKKSI